MVDHRHHINIIVVVVIITGDVFCAIARLYDVLSDVRIQPCETSIRHCRHYCDITTLYTFGRSRGIINTNCYRRFAVSSARESLTVKRP